MITPRSTSDRPLDTRSLTIELLALDLDTCGRCTGTSANLDLAIAAVTDVLREADVEVDVRRTVVTSAAQAEQLQFESSPTIRINGRDIALELRESSCGDCGDLCGCEGQVDCRVWVWRGREHVEAPKAMIIDAILRAYGRAWEPGPAGSRAAFRLPENLRAFFDARSRSSARAGRADCCDRATCCEADDKAACCGTDAAAGGAACGCTG
ncbi:MAG: DUF2703 domain-containing protein [Phycisphaeraceae bacterium]|nr:DUF2703 domain-containing protein [Phycisphaeraceae bacterium]